MNKILDKVKKTLEFLLNIEKVKNFIVKYTVGYIIKNEKVKKRFGNILVNIATFNFTSAAFNGIELLSKEELRKALLKDFKIFADDTSKFAIFLMKIFEDKINVLYEEVLKKFGNLIYEKSKDVYFAVFDFSKNVVKGLKKISINAFNFGKEKTSGLFVFLFDKLGISSPDKKT